MIHFVSYLQLYLLNIPHSRSCCRFNKLLTPSLISLFIDLHDRGLSFENGHRRGARHKILQMDIISMQAESIQIHWYVSPWNGQLPAFNRHCEIFSRTISTTFHNREYLVDVFIFIYV